MLPDLEVLPRLEESPCVGRYRRGVVGDPASDTFELEIPSLPGPAGKLYGFDLEVRGSVQGRNALSPG